MNKQAQELAVTLEPNDTHRLAMLCGQFDSHIKQIETRLDVEIHHRGNQFSCLGNTLQIKTAVNLLQQLYNETNDTEIGPDEVHLALQECVMQTPSLQEHTMEESNNGSEHAVKNKENGNMSTTTSYEGVTEATESDIDNAIAQASIIKTKKSSVKPRGQNQQRYVAAVRNHDINFGVGPAGTGKTYLAVACAVESLIDDKTQRILLVRPAVEAGEKLGFLPGDLAQKVDPYLRPLYDALYEMMGFETVGKLIERSIIEVAPLAYMRGRTLNNSFVILDESQNTTREQMKMFLTRIGFGSTAVITGDPSQIDLPRGQKSGLRHALEVLEGVDGISVTHFRSKDVVRHPIVQRIVDAYEKSEAKQSANTKEHE